MESNKNVTRNTKTPSLLAQNRIKTLDSAVAWKCAMAVCYCDDYDSPGRLILPYPITVLSPSYNAQAIHNILACCEWQHRRLFVWNSSFFYSERVASESE